MRNYLSYPGDPTIFSILSAIFLYTMAPIIFLCTGSSYLDDSVNYGILSIWRLQLFFGSKGSNLISSLTRDSNYFLLFTQASIILSIQTLLLFILKLFLSIFSKYHFYHPGSKRLQFSFLSNQKLSILLRASNKLFYPDAHSSIFIQRQSLCFLFRGSNNLIFLQIHRFQLYFYPTNESECTVFSTDTVQYMALSQMSEEYLHI